MHFAKVAVVCEDFAVPTPPPQLMLLGSIISVQFGSAFADQLFAKAGAGGVVFMRLAIAAVVLACVVRPKLRGHSRRDLFTAILFGVVLSGMNWSFYEAIARIPLGPAVTIEFLGPLAVAVFGSHRLLDLLWALLAGGGVALLTCGDVHGVDTLGVFFALVAAACWAGYILLSKRVGSAFSELDGLAIALVIGSIIVLPIGVIDGGSALLNPSVLAGGVVVALLSSLIPYSLEMTALRRLTPSAFGILMSLEPAFATLAGVLVLSEKLSTTLVFALVMVIAAGIGTTLTTPVATSGDGLLG